MISMLLLMSCENIFITSDTNVITTSSKLVVKDIVSIKKDGKVIGQLDAEIDFADLSPELHERAIQLLSQMPVCLHIPSERVVEDSPRIVHEDTELESRWEKIKKYFRR